MILTTHALVGAAIGSKIESPWLVAALALIVHYLLDGIRHAEYFDDRTATIANTWKKIFLDISVGTAIIAISILLSAPETDAFINILLGAFFSLLPDGASFLYIISKGKILIKLKQFHSLAHRYDKNPKYSAERQWNLRNAANDILFSLIAITILFL